MPGEAATGELLAALVCREPTAFERLVAAYQDRLFNFAVRYTGSREDAEEVVQDAFVKAHRALYQRLAADRLVNLSLTPWLYRIALNTARNHCRRRELPTAPLPAPDEAEDPSGGLHSGGPEDEAERDGLRGALAAELRRLPDRYRAAVVLRHVEGLTYAEIAEVLGQPLGTVKANVHRGMLRMRPGLAAWHQTGCAEEENHALR